MLVLVILVVAVQTNSNASASVLIYLLGLLLYIEIRANTGIVPYMVVIVLLGVSRLLIIPAFGEILRSTSAKVSARPPLSTVTTAWSVSAARGKAGKRSAAASAPASRHRSLAGVIMLLDVGRAATEEQGKME